MPSPRRESARLGIEIPVDDWFKPCENPKKQVQQAMKELPESRHKAGAQRREEGEFESHPFCSADMS